MSHRYFAYGHQERFKYQTYAPCSGRIKWSETQSLIDSVFIFVSGIESWINICQQEEVIVDEKGEMWRSNDNGQLNIIDTSINSLLHNGHNNLIIHVGVSMSKVNVIV